VVQARTWRHFWSLSFIHEAASPQSDRTLWSSLEVMATVGYHAPLKKSNTSIAVLLVSNIGRALGQKVDELQEGKEKSLSYTHTPLPYPTIEQTSIPAISTHSPALSRLSILLKTLSVTSLTTTFTHYPVGPFSVRGV
jgi:hypothetical protein